MTASTAELAPYSHPRIVFGATGWDEVVSMYADPLNFNKQGTWSNYFRSQTLRQVPNSEFIIGLAELERSGGRAAYEARPYEANSPKYQANRTGLKDMADILPTSSAWNADTFVMCSLWASVALKQASRKEAPFIPIETVDTCINAAVAWSKIALAHRTYYCNPDCPAANNFKTFEHVWYTARKFDLHHNWYIGGTGVAFTYDLLYHLISPQNRVMMRSLIAAFALNRYAWGDSPTSTRDSPNALTDPHRIYSNWAGYNSNLYLANLAIEGETGFDAYVAALLTQNNASGFNQGLHDRFSAQLKEFMLHSFNPDSSTFEDGYSYFTGLREGSLGLLASHRRGSNVLGTGRFRNIIHNAAQMYEPWHCGNLMGHASGGGNLYNSYAGLFRYA